MGRKKRKAIVWLSDKQKHEIYLLVLRGAKRKDVAKKYNTSLQQVGLAYNTRFLQRGEIDHIYAHKTEKKQIPQPFNNYGMTTCNECGKLTSIDNPCHQQILTIKTAA